MNMLDEERGCFTAPPKGFQEARKGFTHLSDLDWRAVDRMRSFVGGLAVGPILYILGTDKHHPAITELIQHKLNGAQENVALLLQQGIQHAEGYANRVLSTWNC